MDELPFGQLVHPLGGHPGRRIQPDPLPGGGPPVDLPLPAGVRLRPDREPLGQLHLLGHGRWHYLQHLVRSEDLCAATDQPAATTTTFTYDTGASSPDNHDLKTVNPPDGVTITNTYNSSGQVGSQTSGSSANETDFTYSTSGADETTTVTNYPLGKGDGSCSSTYPCTEMTEEFSEGTLVEKETGLGTDPGPVATYYTPDDTTGIPVQTLNSYGDGTTAGLQTYNLSGGTPTTSANASTVADTTGDTTQYAYNADNQVWCSVAPAEVTAGVSCPSSAPTSPPTSGDGATITIYNSADQPTSVTDPLGHTTLSGYTASGNDTIGSVTAPNALLYCTIDPDEYADGVTSCPAYDATSHVTGTVTQTFDAAGDVLTSTDALGNTTTTTYGAQDGCGVSSGSPWGSATYPWLPATVTDPTGTVTCSAYNCSRPAHRLDRLLRGLFGHHPRRLQRRRPAVLHRLPAGGCGRRPLPDLGALDDSLRYPAHRQLHDD